MRPPRVRQDGTGLRGACSCSPPTAHARAEAYSLRRAGVQREPAQEREPAKPHTPRVRSAGSLPALLESVACFVTAPPPKAGSNSRVAKVNPSPPMLPSLCTTSTTGCVSSLSSHPCLILPTQPEWCRFAALATLQCPDGRVQGGSTPTNEADRRELDRDRIAPISSAPHAGDVWLPPPSKCAL